MRVAALAWLYAPRTMTPRFMLRVSAEAPEKKREFFHHYAT
jgi:hypothetical protein